MDVDKICRACLSLSGPFLSIYDGNSGSGSAGCLADMLSDFTKTKPRRADKLPEKVCLSCISEINHCYSFKLKCENSNRTLRQLIPDALPEEPDVNYAPKPTIVTIDKEAQTISTATATQEVQTDAQLTSPINEDDGDDDDDADLYELNAIDDEPSKSNECSIVLHVEKDDKKYESDIIFNNATGELAATVGGDKHREYKLTIFNDLNCEPDVKSENTTLSQVTTRKSAAKQQQQQKQQEQLQQQQKEEEQQQQKQETIQPLGTRNNRRRPATKSCNSTDGPKKFKAAKVTRPDLRRVPNNVNGEKSKTHMKHHCELCNAGFAMETSLAIHRRQKSCTNRSFKCNECERVFVSLDHLEEHQATHGSHSCNECGQMYESKEELGIHMVNGHKRNLRNQCNVCQKVFTMLSTLRDHMRIHTGEKPFLCNICGKGFTQNANLRQHKLRHSDIKRFKCEMCSRSFVTKAELASHVRTHTGDKPFECEVCKAKFTTSCSLAKHKRKHTGERPYACDLCPMRFTALNVLKNHRRTHTGERPYICPHCSRSFTQRGDCQNHQRTHQGEKVFICPVCSDEFNTMEAMRTHLLVHEQQDLVHFTIVNAKDNELTVVNENVGEEVHEQEEEEEQEH